MDARDIPEMDPGELTDQEFVNAVCDIRKQIAEKRRTACTPAEHEQVEAEQRVERGFSGLFLERCRTEVEKVVRWQVFGRGICPAHLDRQAFMEDAVSATLLNVDRGVCGYEATASLKTWLGRITVNTLFDLVRKEIGRGSEQRQYLSLDAPEQPSDPGGQPQYRSQCWLPPKDPRRDREISVLFWEIFERCGQESPVSHESNIVMRLRAIDELSAVEVAQKRGTTPGAIDQMFSRDISKYRKRFGSRGIARPGEGQSA